MNRNTLLLVLGLSLLLAVMAIGLAFNFGDGEAWEEPELRIYEVPNGLADEVRSVVRSVLSRGEEVPSGTVSVAPGGKLLVLASPRVHAGIHQLVRSIEGGGTEVAAPQLELTYWVVLARANPSPQRPASGIPELTGVLDAVAAELGPMDTVLLERLQVGSRSGASASTRGAYMRVNQTASFTEGGIVARLDISSNGPHSLRTEVRLGVDEIAVLGQTNLQFLPDLPKDPFDDWEEGKMMFYVVKASVKG